MPDKIDSVLKPSTIAAIRSATSITVQLYDQKDVGSPIAVTQPRNLSGANASLLRTLILDSGSWFFAVKRCLPRAIAEFLFQEEGTQVAVSIDSCAGWEVRGPVERRGAFFDPIREEIYGILKSTFPEYASPHRRSLWKAGVIREVGEQAIADRVGTKSEA